MTIDLKKLQKTIEAEVNLREYERVTASAEAAQRPSDVPNDLVHTFELLDLEGFLPPRHEAPAPAEAVAASVPDDAPPAQTPPPSLYRRLRQLPVVGRLLSHPRIMNFLTRARQRPGGATLKNVSLTLAHAGAVRIPGGLRLRQQLAVLGELPQRLSALEWHIADGQARLRNIGVQVQNQTNQSLYTHGLAIQQNEQYLIERMRRLEHVLREQALTIAGLQAARPAVERAVGTVQAPIEDTGMPADLYLEFEASFRGSPELVRERLKRNLDYFQFDPEQPSLPVLDLGCGRGEWLQLLKEEGIRAIGVDSNTAMIESCKQAGLEVHMGDALQYLAALPANSLGGLTAFHIIEHLPLGVLVRLIDEARRVVCPGGVVIFETPNPENLITGACNFYVDPTHRNPLPPALVAFLLKARGFERVEIDPRHPGDPSLLLQGTDEAINVPLNRLLFGPQDYAAIGYAP